LKSFHDHSVDGYPRLRIGERVQQGVAFGSLISVMQG
jgi:hypothetical protein